MSRTVPRVWPPPSSSAGAENIFILVWRTSLSSASPLVLQGVMPDSLEGLTAYIGFEK